MGYASERFRQQRLAKHTPPPHPRGGWGSPQLTSELLERQVANKPDPALKGVLNGNCNREACQRPGAVYWNTSTRAYYCRGCAHDINRTCERFGDPKILFLTAGAEADAAMNYGDQR